MYNVKMEKRKTRLNILVWLVSAVVLALVVLMRRVKLDLGIDFSFLPPVYSTLNAICALFLILGFREIKRGRIETHKKWILAAVGCSVLFLLGYVLYHFTTPETLYCKEGAIRYVYFFLLITHIFLAAGIFPFILITLVRALTNEFDRHKKMARWVFPLWLYVAVTGPILYMMLYSCY